MDKVMIISLYILLFISISYLCLIFANYIYYKGKAQLKDKITDIKKNNKKYKYKLKKIKRFEFYRDKKEKKYRKSIELTIEKSNIPITVEVFIIGSFILALIVFIYVSMVINFIFGIALGIVTYSLPKKMLELYTYFQNEKLNKSFIVLLTGLDNYCSVDDDIIKGLEASIGSVDNPFKTYLITFIQQFKIGNPDSFTNLINKIDDKRIRFFFVNIHLCFQYNGKYIEVIKENKASFQEYYIEKERRKKEISTARMWLIIIILVCLLIVKTVMDIIPNLWQDIRASFIGNVILGFLIFSFIHAIYKCITLEKINV